MATDIGFLPQTTGPFDIDAVVDADIKRLAKEQGITLLNGGYQFGQGATKTVVRGDPASYLYPGGRSALEARHRTSYQDQVQAAALRDFQENQRSQRENFARAEGRIGGIEDFATGIDDRLREPAREQAGVVMRDADRLDALGGDIRGDIGAITKKGLEGIDGDSDLFRELIAESRRHTEESVATMEEAVATYDDRRFEVAQSIAEGVRARTRDAAAMASKGVRPDGTMMSEAERRQLVATARMESDREIQQAVSPILAQMEDVSFQNKSALASVRQGAAGVYANLASLTTGNLAAETQAYAQLGGLALGGGQIAADLAKASSGARISAQGILSASELNAARLELDGRNAAAGYTIQNPYAAASFLDVMLALGAQRSIPFQSNAPVIF